MADIIKIEINYAHVQHKSQNLRGVIVTPLTSYWRASQVVSNSTWVCPNTHSNKQ